MKTLLLFILFFSVGSLQASEFVGAKTAGMGGAGSAAVESIDSLYLNPAGIASTRKLFFGSGYSFGSLVPGVSRETYSFTMSDGSPEVAIPGAFSYRYHRIGVGDTAFKEQEFKAGVGLNLFPRLSLGMAYSHLKARSDTEGTFKQNNVDLGLRAQVYDHWSLALTGEGLMKPNDNLPGALRRQSRWGLGTLVNVMRILQLRYDIKSTLHRGPKQGMLAHHMGIGFALRSSFLLNLGMSIDDIVEQNWRSVGLVWEGPKLKLGYSIQNESRSGLETRHLVDLWLDL